ncbi:DUF4184 family protein [Microbacterium ulmi]|uniref:DUF4184 family protein n=1 Tax=Microbacterium ulmi TaxID=179095 RepID=A0A7Y2M0A6_9MICO|nr:DUF4184 family protein [Microbacterium ulmi]NII70659.1 hypothetical protein [Microbacterium ulmi]NNH04100.1 DUF4184 family protein [Microbacterium ulmi]
MPFTPSHAVVALPFVRTPLVPAAVAVGAMTPDLPLFVRGTPLTYAYTHSAEGVVVTSLVALVLLFVWRSVLRPAARELSPRALAARLPGEWDAGAAASALETLGVAHSGPRRAWYPLALAASILIGVISHPLWDAFTHEGRLGLAALQTEWGPLPGYKWLQYGSGIVGLAIIAVWAVLWLRKRSAAASVDRVLPSAVRWAWWASLPVILAIAWATGLFVSGPLDAEFTVAHLAYRVLPPASALWCGLTFVLCVIVQLVRARRKR